MGTRDWLHRELWTTTDTARTQQLLDELQVDLIYIGQLERFLHPEGAAKFDQMARDGMLRVVYQNDRVTIYATPGFEGDIAEANSNVPGTVSEGAAG